MEKVAKIKEKRNVYSPFTIIMGIVLALYAVTLIVLLGWAVITGCKSQDDFYVNKYKLPTEWYWNFEYVYSQFTVTIQTELGSRNVGMPEMYMNSILYSVGCAFAATLVPCITAYACAKYEYRFSKIVYSIVLVAMIVPFVGSLPAEVRMAQRFRLYNHIWGMWIMKANFLGMYFLVFYAGFKCQPKAYMEAATVDGAGNWRIMTQISLPLIRNLFFTVILINFITFWNDYQSPLVYLPSYPTVAYGMFKIKDTVINGMSTVPMRMAATTMMLAPVIILFALFSKRLLGNLSIGGIKG